jgi:hypothetical protein
MLKASEVLSSDDIYSNIQLLFMSFLQNLASSLLLISFLNKVKTMLTLRKPQGHLVEYIYHSSFMVQKRPPNR